MEQAQTYKLDLTETDGNGDFSCPQCGTVISPDETTEQTYSILEPKVNGLDLEELVICCKVCKSQIHLTGFSISQELSVE
ncbi:MAG TPA: hypothetical protein VK536_00940 [Candidatus Limnocylindrales bacterium]|nr:hypothetical protein [Candidatus Limnocylindrales bacterium]